MLTIEQCLRRMDVWGFTHVYYAEEHRLCPSNRALAAELGVKLIQVS